MRERFYQDFKEAKEKGGIRWMGSAWAPDAVTAGLGKDVYCITGEPYGATCAWNRPLSAKYLEAAESFGFARDLCAYMRNYWGSILTNNYALGGEFPKADFAWSQHICCSHAKWYQNVSELKGGDVLFFEAVWNDIRSTNKWAKICMLNRAIPAPLDEKSIYSLYVFGTLQQSKREFADFYDELYDEVKDRVDRGIAAVANEKARVMSDTQPPWGFLDIYRYMESWGAVSIGSLYTFGLEGMWLYDEEKGDLRPRPLPPEKPKTREDACMMLADWHLSKPEYQHFYHPEYKTKMMDAIARHWKCDGIILHYNRGCEGLSIGIAENRLGLLERGHKVMAYEGNMGDEREFDKQATLNRIDIFLESLGLKQSK